MTLKESLVSERNISHRREKFPNGEVSANAPQVRAQHRGLRTGGLMAVDLHCSRC